MLLGYLQNDEPTNDEPTNGAFKGGKNCFINNRSFFKFDPRLTFITVPHGEEINIITFFVEEEQADPRIEGVDRDDEQNPDDPSLLRRVRVPSQVFIYLQKKKKMNQDECM